MEGVFREFENENAIRSYPFASGCVHAESQDGQIPAGVFVDAAIYPVNPSGTLYLSGVSEGGVFSVSDATGVVMSGSASGRTVELYDASPFGRHAGTLVASSEDALAEFAGRGAERSYSADNAAFASSCVFPVVLDGVVSVSVGGLGPASGSVSFSNRDSDQVRVSSGASGSGKTIRFDVLPRLSAPASVSIRRIICVVDGQTPFRIQKLFNKSRPDDYGYNTVVLKLEGIDRDSVCAAAHREESLEMADTCECKPRLPTEEQLPEAYQLEEVFIPPDEDGTSGGAREGAENAFFLVVPNELGHPNPLSITLEDGAVVPDLDGASVVIEGNSAELADGEMTDKVSSKAVVIQVPGLSGGAS